MCPEGESSRLTPPARAMSQSPARRPWQAKCKATSFQGADLSGDGAGGTPVLVDGDKTIAPGGTP